MTLPRIVRAINSISVKLARLDIRQIAMPYFVGLLWKHDTLRLLRIIRRVKKAELNFGRMF